MSYQIKDGKLVSGRVRGRIVGGDYCELHLTISESGNGRKRMSISPYYVQDREGLWIPIFATAGQIIADPLNEEPGRPVGHCYETHLSPTRRWLKDDYPVLVERIELFRQTEGYGWEFIYSDGGSNYYRFTVDTDEFRMQVANDSGRTMIGLLCPNNFVLKLDDGSQIEVNTYIQRRIVIKEGDKSGRSPEGSTQYAFGGIVT